MRHLLSLVDWPAADVVRLLDLADEVKRSPASYRGALDGKALGLVFLKASTRTRVSFEVAIRQLGGYGVFLARADSQLGRGETIPDTARVLSRYLDVIMARLYGQEDLEELAAFSSVPVINGLTDRFHPCQALADIMTAREVFGDLHRRKLAYVGDGNNMAHSLLLACARVGMSVAIASPDGYEVEAGVLAAARAGAEETGAEVLLTEDPSAAVHGADVVYTDVWTSMGQEAEQEKRLEAFRGFCVDEELMSLASPEAIFLHCLPCHRGEEVTAEVVDGPRSRVWDQAENRLHVQKAVLLTVCGAG